MPLETKIAEDLVARDSLVDQYQNYVRTLSSRLIKRFGASPALRDDIVSAGYIGLIEAAERFDPSAGVEFKTFAYLRIRGAIIDAIRRSSDLSPAAYRYARALSAVQDLRSGVRLNTLRTGKDPKKALAQILEFTAQGALAFRLSLVEVEDEPLHLGEKSHPEERLIAKARDRFLRELVDELPERERNIVKKYYFEDKSLQEIAEEESGVSKSWMSRVHSRALNMLRERCLEKLGGDREAI